MGVTLHGGRLTGHDFSLHVALEVNLRSIHVPVDTGHDVKERKLFGHKKFSPKPMILQVHIEMRRPSIFDLFVDKTTEFGVDLDPVDRRIPCHGNVPSKYTP